MQQSGLWAAAFAGAGSVATTAAQAAREKELNILCWEGYNSAQVLDPFRSSRGATVKAESLTNDPTMINRLRAGETNIWDLINVNNPWARKVMLPEKLIKPLDRAKFEPFFNAMMPEFKAPYKWAMDDAGEQLIGMAQRFGPYSFVVNTNKVSRAAQRIRAGICGMTRPTQASTAFWSPMTGTCSASAASPVLIPSRCTAMKKLQSSLKQPSACSRVPS